LPRRYWKQGGTQKDPFRGGPKAHSHPSSRRLDSLTQYDLRSKETTFSADAKRTEGGFEVTIGGRTHLVRLSATADPKVFVAQVADRLLNFILEEASSKRVTIVIEGERLSFVRPLGTLEVIKPQDEQSFDRPPNYLFPAPMPGRVISVMGKKGDHVLLGTPLLMIESMKMETVVTSDREGVLEEVLVGEGATVKRGQALLRFSG